MSATPVAMPRRGWLIIAGVIVVSSFGSGLPWYAVGILFSPLVETFGWGRGMYSLAMSLYLVSMTLGSVPAGRLVDRWGSRRVMLVTAISSALMWGLISQVGQVERGSAIWQLGTLYVLLGLSSAGLGGVSCTALIARWFPPQTRGRAMGLANIGGSVPGVILVPLSAPFIAAYGWRALCLLFAGLVLLALPFILRVLRDPPLAAPIPRGTAPAGAGRDLTTRQALATATFWVMGLACLLGQSGSSAVQMHAIPFLMDRGLTRATASNIWGTLALAAIAGRIGLGWLADRYEARVTMFIAVCLQAGSVVIALAFPGVMAAWAFALLFGLGMGAQNGSRPLLPAEYFGTRAYGTIWGLVTLFTLPGSAGGQPLAGFLYDLTGNYRTPYLVFVATWMVGLLALVLLGRPPERQVTAARR